jgi:hypothetical protein
MTHREKIQIHYTFISEKREQLIFIHFHSDQTMNRNLLLLNRVVRCCKFATAKAAYPYPLAVQGQGQGQLRLPRQERHLTTKSGKNDEQHAFFNQQLQELDQERDSLYGKEEQTSDQQQQPRAASGRDDHAFFEEQMNELNQDKIATAFASQQEQQEQEAAMDDELNDDNDERDSLFPHTEEEMEDMKEEREDLYQFTQDEKDAWTGGAGTIPSDLLQQIQQARDNLQQQQEHPRNDYSLPPSQDDSSSAPAADAAFTHVTQDGNSVHMVDVGQKEVTQRMARAQCKVIFPPEVMKAFQSYDGELIGPKGPIFATAKIAGIMAAK